LGRAISLPWVAEAPEDNREVLASAAIEQHRCRIIMSLLRLPAGLASCPLQMTIGPKDAYT
jgi:hypothetical protein